MPQPRHIPGSCASFGTGPRDHGQTLTPLRFGSTPQYTPGPAHTPARRIRAGRPLWAGCRRPFPAPLRCSGPSASPVSPVSPAPSGSPVLQGPCRRMGAGVLTPRPAGITGTVPSRRARPRVAGPGGTSTGKPRKNLAPVPGPGVAGSGMALVQERPTRRSAPARPHHGARDGRARPGHPGHGGSAQGQRRCPRGARDSRSVIRTVRLVLAGVHPCGAVRRGKASSGGDAQNARPRGAVADKGERFWMKASCGILARSPAAPGPCPGSGPAEHGGSLARVRGVRLRWRGHQTGMPLTGIGVRGVPRGAQAQAGQGAGGRAVRRGQPPMRPERYLPMQKAPNALSSTSEGVISPVISARCVQAVSRPTPSRS